MSCSAKFVCSRKFLQRIFARSLGQTPLFARARRGADTCLCVQLNTANLASRYHSSITRLRVFLLDRGCHSFCWAMRRCVCSCIFSVVVLPPVSSTALLVNAFCGIMYRPPVKRNAIMRWLATAAQLLYPIQKYFFYSSHCRRTTDP
jgi:hypothetical protein